MSLSTISSSSNSLALTNMPDNVLEKVLSFLPNPLVAARVCRSFRRAADNAILCRYANSEGILFAKEPQNLGRTSICSSLFFRFLMDRYGVAFDQASCHQIAMCVSKIATAAGGAFDKVDVVYDSMTILDLTQGFRHVSAEGYLDPLRVIMADRRFKEFTVDDLSNAFQAAAANGRVECLREIMSCTRFHELSADHLGKAFRSAAGCCRVVCLREIMSCSRFKEISVDGLNQAFQSAVKYACVECLREIMSCSRFHELSADDLGEAFGLAAAHGYTGAEHGYVECLCEIMSCTRFRGISVDRLIRAFHLAVEGGHSKCLHEIISHERFHEVPSDELIQAFRLLVTRISELRANATDADFECLQEIMSCRRFDLIEAYKLSAANGHIDRMRRITSCRRFHDEVSVNDLGNALILAAANGHVECLRAIMFYRRFNEVSLDDLRWAVHLTEENGHVECMQMIKSCKRFLEQESVDDPEQDSLCVSHNRALQEEPVVAEEPVSPNMLTGHVGMLERLAPDHRCRNISAIAVLALPVILGMAFLQ